LKNGEPILGVGLATRDDLDAGLAAFRSWCYRALFVQALFIVGTFAAALAYLR
jgi:hypothetical protein